MKYQEKPFATTFHAICSVHCSCCQPIELDTGEAEAARQAHNTAHTRGRERDAAPKGDRKFDKRRKTPHHHPQKAQKNLKSNRAPPAEQNFEILGRSN